LGDSFLRAAAHTATEQKNKFFFPLRPT